jgi:hypothetical protein
LKIITLLKCFTDRRDAVHTDCLWIMMFGDCIQLVGESSMSGEIWAVGDCFVVDIKN